MPSKQSGLVIIGAVIAAFLFVVQRQSEAGGQDAQTTGNAANFVSVIWYNRS